MAWYHTYFKGLPQTAWKKHQDEEITALETDFLWDVLELEAGYKVLDVLSGYGRHAIPLAKEGCELICVDISQEYCDELKKASLSGNLGIHVICDDILETQQINGSFDAAYCFGNSFSFFPRNDLKKMISTIVSHLKTGGNLAIHTQNLADNVFTNFQTRNWMPVGDQIIYLAENVYNPIEGCIEAEQTFISGDEKVTHQVKQYIFTLSEICAMLQEAGLKILGTYSTIEADQFLLGDEELYLVAQKV